MVKNKRFGGGGTCALWPVGCATERGTIWP